MEDRGSDERIVITGGTNRSALHVLSGKVMLKKTNIEVGSMWLRVYAYPGRSFQAVVGRARCSREKTTPYSIAKLHKNKRTTRTDRRARLIRVQEKKERWEKSK